MQISNGIYLVYSETSLWRTLHSQGGGSAMRRAYALDAVLGEDILRGAAVRVGSVALCLEIAVALAWVEPCCACDRLHMHMPHM